MKNFKWMLMDWNKSFENKKHLNKLVKPIVQYWTLFNHKMMKSDLDAMWKNPKNKKDQVPLLLIFAKPKLAHRMTINSPDSDLCSEKVNRGLGQNYQMLHVHQLTLLCGALVSIMVVKIAIQIVGSYDPTIRISKIDMDHA